MRKLVLYQAGGLGNQLFQLAFTQSLPSFDKVIIVDQIECDFIREVTNELINSHTCRAFEIVHRKSTWIERKMRNILLRKSNGESHRQFSWQNLLNLTVRIVNQVMVNRISLHVPETVGFDERLSSIKPSRTAVLVGYFQSYEWAQSAKGAYSRVLERSVSDSIRNSKLARDLAAEESICVQVRLGDITLKKNEPIGSLNLEYFQASFEKLAGNRSNIQLYIFTNDSASLMQFLRNCNNLSPQLISNEYSCVDNLWLMSQSQKLIISNSTFAWWGGFGSTSTNNTVVAPTPWFAELKSPEKLIPNSWIQVSRS
jgi:hypothetical protein